VKTTGKINRSIEDLISDLKEQLVFLRSSCDAYDAGNMSEAKRIALPIRVLLHDTDKSKSVFKQLDIKDRVRFLDTAHPYYKDNLHPSSCLTSICFSSDGKANIAKVTPLLSTYKNFQVEAKYTSFSEWWNGVIIDDKSQEFTRKDVILSVVNTDGGAHVDPELKSGYYNLTRKNSMNQVIHINGTEEPLENHCLASIRQIGFELSSTLKEQNIDLWRFQ
jgi:hypothetical protein